MEHSYMETVAISSDNAALEIKIKDFRAATKPFSKEVNYIHTYKNFEFSFLAHIFPGEDTEDLLEIRPFINVNNDLLYAENFITLHCTVSLIDIEGNSRFPVSYQKPSYEMVPIKLTERLSRNAQYLKKSFILNKSEELLPDGVLTLRVDFHFEMGELTPVLSEFPAFKENFLSCRTQDRRIMNVDQTRYPNDIIMEDASRVLKVFDYTYRILSLPQFHEARRRFGVYGIHPQRSSPSSESEEDSTDVLEHVWIFDTETARFLLSLDEKQDSVGVRLLKASPVIRRMINVPMREQQEKRIEFGNIGHSAFFHILDFLKFEKLLVYMLNELMDVYKFSHLYEMEDLQRKCAELLVKKFEYKELERIADHYPNKYLSELLKSLRIKYENLEQPLFSTDDIPYSDCYI